MHVCRLTFQGIAIGIAPHVNMTGLPDLLMVYMVSMLPIKHVSKKLITDTDK